MSLKIIWWNSGQLPLLDADWLQHNLKHQVKKEAGNWKSWLFRATSIVNVCKTNLCEVEQVRQNKPLTSLLDYIHVRDHVTVAMSTRTAYSEGEISLYDRSYSSVSLYF